MVSEPTKCGLLVRDAAFLCGFWTYLGMCCIAKSVFILAINNGSKPCFCPLVSDIGISNWFKYQISKPTSRGMLAKGETCLYGFQICLQGPVCQGATCLVYKVSKPTSSGMFARAAGLQVTGFACADPKKFVRGGPTLTAFVFLVDEGWEDPNTTISGSSSAHHHWRADDGQTLIAGSVALLFLRDLDQNC